ncbi:M23 family metallopeptidase [Nocardioides daphniae]|uniref:M23 family metallopeptidase n=1 Tax=Nocardioides daphniae TaxID=402297 RepID=UPI001930FFBB|nr:M23 family metallopeptidase [Nocardioides daphniae]
MAVPARLPAISTVDLPAAPVAGKRRAAAHTGSRGPLFKGLPSLPVLAGAAALAISVGGAVLGPGLDSDQVSAADVSASNALTSAASAALADRGGVVSRDSRREAKAEESEAKLVAAAEAAADARSKTLQGLHAQANKQAAIVEANLWHMPVSNYRLTATFGLSSHLWSTVHTGLDFAGATGTPLIAVANGTITETGSAGSYGYRTILTLEDGTEIWYCHQSAINVSVGDKVAGGDVIGALGSTGNSTGPHLHLEVRPGGGSPVDPYSTLLSHGLQP